ncbi:MAG: element excision factor XisH family protein [Bacteroidia bacterium]
MARDIFHQHVREALEKEGWKITHDPLTLMPEEDGVAVDLGAERIIAAEKEQEKIAVEVKSFLSPSLTYAYHEAVGQYLNYLIALEASNEKRDLFLAVTDEIFDRFEEKKLIRLSIERYRVKILIFNPETKEIVSWKK